jgi:hypothetical protein
MALAAEFGAVPPAAVAPSFRKNAFEALSPPQSAGGSVGLAPLAQSP